MSGKFMDNSILTDNMRFHLPCNDQMHISSKNPGFVSSYLVIEMHFRSYQVSNSYYMCTHAFERIP